MGWVISEWSFTRPGKGEATSSDETSGSSRPPLARRSLRSVPPSAVPPGRSQTWRKAGPVLAAADTSKHRGYSIRYGREQSFADIITWRAHAPRLFRSRLGGARCKPHVFFCGLHYIVQHARPNYMRQPGS